MGDSALTAPIALLDACVLVGVVRRECLFAAGRDGFMRPIWSERIEEEWRRALIRMEGEAAAAAIGGEIALARVAFPDAVIRGWEDLEGPLSLPDWDDRHVLAAAIKGGASIIVTDNLSDFPRRALAEHNLRAQAADAFLRAWAEARPEVVASFAVQICGGGDPSEARAHFKRARLPRFAKEVERVLRAG